MNGQHYIGILPGVSLHRYEKQVHIVLLQHSHWHPRPILSATLNNAACSFYWPTVRKSLKKPPQSPHCGRSKVSNGPHCPWIALMQKSVCNRKSGWRGYKPLVWESRHKIASSNAWVYWTAAADVKTTISGLTRPSNREQMHLQILHNSETLAKCASRGVVYITNMFWPTAGLLWKYFGCEDRSVD